MKSRSCPTALFRLEKAWGGSHSKYTMYREGKAKLFSAVPCGRTRGNRHEVQHRKFPLEIGKHFFTVKVMEHLNGMPQEADCPFLEVFKIFLDNLFYLTSADDLLRSLPTSALLWYTLILHADVLIFFTKRSTSWCHAWKYI